MAWTITGSSVSTPSTPIQQLAVTRRPDAHREVIIEMPLGDGVADGVEHVFVSDVVLSSGLRDAHGTTRYLVRTALSRNLVSSIRIGDGSRDHKQTAEGSKQALESRPNRSPRLVSDPRISANIREYGRRSPKTLGLAGAVFARVRGCSFRSTSFFASRRSVLTRSPVRTGISDGATTSQATPIPLNSRHSANPPGPAS
jgi:hypothetical protein